jgi:hypothetical protein
MIATAWSKSGSGPGDAHGFLLHRPIQKSAKAYQIKAQKRGK